MSTKRMVMIKQLSGVRRCWCGVRSFTTGAQYCDKPPFNILFLGTDSFALETLKALHLNRLSSGESRVVDTLHVVSTSVKSPVANFARSHDLTLLTWPPKLCDLDLYDLGVLVSFGKMVPRKIIAKFPHGILNVHPSLLPRWRGASPVLHTVLNADSETGLSVISIQPSHFDRGPIVQQERVTIPQNMSAESLAEVLALKGAGLLLTTLQAMPDILNTATPQADTDITYAHKFTSAMAWVNWEQHSVRQVRQQYLALQHLLPLRSMWNQQTIKLLDMVVDADDNFTPSSLLPPSLQYREEGKAAAEAGAVTFDPQLQAVCVKCANGWVAFRYVVLRKQMSSVDFYNGYLSKGKHTDVRFQSLSNGLFNTQYWDFVCRPRVNKS